MNADFRVTEIFTEPETNDVIALCYDVLYEETFEKFLGNPEEFDGKENASNLLSDSNYEISEEIRADIEDIFGVREFNAENGYDDGYQFYDFGDDDFEEDEFKIVEESFSLREALNKIDWDTDNKYDLLNLYEACNLNENEKRTLANIVYDQNDPSVIYDTLNDRFLGKEIEMPERVKDGVIHEGKDSEFHRLKKLYKDYKQFKDIDAESGMISDLIDDLKNKGISFEEYKHKTDKGVTIFYDSVNESNPTRKYEDKPLTESTFRGVPNTTIIWHGEWSDPEIAAEYDGKTYVANYYEVEDAAYQFYKDDKEYMNSNDDNEADRLRATYKFDDSDEDFNKWCKEHSDYIINDIIEFGKVEDGKIDWNIEDSLKEDFSSDKQDLYKENYVVEMDTVGDSADLYSEYELLNLPTGTRIDLEDISGRIYKAYVLGQCDTTTIYVKFNEGDRFNSNTDECQEVSISNIVKVYNDDIENWDDTDDYDFEAEYNQSLEEVADQLDNYGEEEAAEYLYMNNHIYHGYKDKIAKELGIETEYRRLTNAYKEAYYKKGDRVILSNGSTDTVREDINDPDEVLTFKRDIETAENLIDIENLIWSLSDGVAEDAVQRAFNENEDAEDLQIVKDAIIRELDIYLEDNEWLGESKSLKESLIGGEYKGYQILIDDDIFNNEDETVDMNWQIIDTDGKKVATVKGLRNARKYIDNLPNQYIGKKVEIDLQGAIGLDDESYQLLSKYNDKVLEIVGFYDGEGTFKESSWDISDGVNTLEGVSGTLLSLVESINESKSIRESSEETPYTKKQIEQDLKSITHNFTDKEGELKCGFEEEKNFGVEILKKHYKVVETSGDDMREGTWYHISYAEPKVNEDFNKYRDEEGHLLADKWYASVYPDDEVGIEQLNGLTMDDILKDRSLVGHCDTQVRDRVYKQLDKYIPLSFNSPMYKEKNESKSTNESSEQDLTYKDSDSWLVIKNRNWYDPEGLNIEPPQHIVCKGTKEECTKEFDKIVAHAKKEDGSRWVSIEELSDTHIKIYYPMAVSRAIYQLIPNKGAITESSESFQKEFYNGYVILKNRAGDGWDIYSYDGTPEKVTNASLEDEGYATLKDAKAEIDKWIDSMNESVNLTDNKDFSSITALADDCGKNTLKDNPRDLTFTFNNESDAVKFMDELRNRKVVFRELRMGDILVSKSQAMDESK